MESITNMIAAIAALLAKPKSEKVGLIRQLRKTLKRSEKTYFKAKRKFSRKGIDAKEQEQLDQLWKNMMDLSDEIENINN